MCEAGVRRMQELPGVSLVRQNEITEDSDSPEINEEMRHPMLESADETRAQDLDGSRFWAVLISVDGDPHYPLHGCVSDAELMEKYLIENLGVPSNHIQRLLGPTGERPQTILFVLLVPISSRHLPSSMAPTTHPPLIPVLNPL
ncbi:hypothetical protein ARMGADRAFT_1164235 [Armillaria gallica]|uniref:Uncharacterized protein n=1 Tax=Armillaria gallica TaxID=47427 RepID=A0A2H3DKI2_ARMGA|nr:hypothetical protein ARMGADRAFT_1164235 [Armillaria gallica]